ncbi:MAG: hypothetical protein AAFO69_12185 [Bacteroidota bacterium]
MLIHRAISFLSSALMLLMAYWQVTIGDYWAFAILYGISALLCFASVLNYSWKYISLTVHILFVLLSLYYIGSAWEWIKAGADVGLLKTSGDPTGFIDGTKSFMRLSLGALIMFYHYRIAKD